MQVRYQHDSMQCGIACLAMICGHYGMEYSFDALSQICHATSEGVSLLGIREAAEVLHLEAVSAKVPFEKLAEIKLPCILHWNQNHFVVLYRMKKNRLYIADPGKGKICYTEEEFKAHWITTSIRNGDPSGIAMIINPTPQFFENKTEHKTVKRSIKFLLGYFKQYNKYFWQVLISLVIGSCIQLILPFLTQAIVDTGINNKDIGIIWLILSGQFVLILSRTLIDFVRRCILLKISMKINISLVSDFFIKLLKLPMSFFDTRVMGDLMQRKNDHYRVERFLTEQTLSVLFSIVSFVVFGIVLFSYSCKIFFLFIVGSILYGLWIILFLNKRKLIDYELFGKQSENNSKTYQFLTTIQEIKLQNCERRRREEWITVQEEMFAVQQKSLRLQQTQEAGGILINELKNMVITVVAATSVINGDLTLGMMLAVQYIIGQLNSPIERLMQFFYSIQDVKLSLDRINEIHQMQEEDGKDRNKTVNSICQLKLEKIDFKYNLHSPNYTLKGIDCLIPKGKVTAIVGASGSGKTTLIKLLLGYYPVMSGTVYIGEDDINSINLKSWRNKCGVVMQDGVIFSETIERNIAVGDEDVDLDKLNDAAKVACIYEYIQSLPLRYNTKIGAEGIGLSQGQKQRILIARAVYKNPDYIFFDEATNSLDANNERSIVNNLETFYEGKTVVIVAHRLSTVKNADQILVLDKGRIAEAGDHINLIERKGIYFELVKNQLELGN